MLLSNMFMVFGWGIIVATTTFLTLALVGWFVKIKSFRLLVDITGLKQITYLLIIRLQF